MSEMYLLAAKALKMGLEAHEDGKSSLDIFYRLRNRLLKKESKIFVFGPAGVGKSTFGRVMSDQFQPSRDSQYKSSVDTEVYTVDLKTNSVLYVSPGQKKLREFRWTDQLQELQSDQAVGIVNVVAYGYHSLRDAGLADLPFCNEEMSQSEMVAAYLKDRRNEELEILEYLKPQLQSMSNKIWMMTLVAKQDLWWDDRKEVEKEYSEGPYADLLSEIKRVRGQVNFGHLISSGSFILQHLRDGNDEIIARISEDYDEPMRLGQLTHLRQRFEQLIK